MVAWLLLLLSFIFSLYPFQDPFSVCLYRKLNKPATKIAKYSTPDFLLAKFTKNRKIKCLKATRAIWQVNKNCDGFTKFSKVRECAKNFTNLQKLQRWPKLHSKK